MNPGLNPVFLSRGQIDRLHEIALGEYGGGALGVRDSAAIDSALGRGRLMLDYVQCDLFDLASCYVHGISQAQGYVDGNKRTAVYAALIFLEANGVVTKRMSDKDLYDTIIGAAGRTVTRDDIGNMLMNRLDPQENNPKSPAVAV